MNYIFLSYLLATRTTLSMVLFHRRVELYNRVQVGFFTKRKTEG